MHHVRSWYRDGGVEDTNPQNTVELCEYLSGVFDRHMRPYRIEIIMNPE
jgi:hypothetical protein